MDSATVAIWVGAIVTGLITAVGYYARRSDGQADDRLRDMAADRDYYRDRYLSLLEAADRATKTSKVS